MTPIERAARAMYDTVQPEWEWDDPDAELMRRMYRENARAAILAIREPSEAMVRAGGANMDHEGATLPDELEQRASTSWRAMIDAMLEEG